jgi:tripartite-type tricarboxylate transporter receptor subunit TctC
MMDAGRVKALAVLAKERIGAFPNVPTVKEAIGRDYSGGTWRGIVGPAGLPPEVVSRLGDAVEKVAKGSEFQAFMNERGFGTAWARGDDFTRFLAEQHKRNGEVMGALGIRQRN